eukprot:TRINITY_DN5969_c0_g1_i1.p1 TRINITY_DN5969_c0_g1~~TRINITY_DN5969_c0_g1_i1.p1  ORF type:complete len:296 (+),score=61.71 TRINITY_DN5969_c0_g1_i1:148-1035(+)
MSESAAPSDSTSSTSSSSSSSSTDSPSSVEEEPLCSSCCKLLFGDCVEINNHFYHATCIVCMACHKRIVGEIMTVDHYFFHADCLACSHCHTSLKDAEFHFSHLDYKLYCSKHAGMDVKSGGVSSQRGMNSSPSIEKDATSTASEEGETDEDDTGLVCVGCEQSIGSHETAITAMDKPWHADCFVCAYCRTSLGGQPYYTRDNEPYCEHDFKALFGFRCAGCKDIFVGGQYMTLGAKKLRYHPKCFVCSVCKKSLQGQAFIVDDYTVYCSDDYEKRARLSALNSSSSSATESVKV